MIQIQNLGKYHGSKLIFDNISYHFPAAARVALVGPNGTGKSTLLNIICGLEEADKGSVQIPQQLVLGFLPQEPNPNPRDSIYEECRSGAKNILLLEQKVNEAIDRLAYDSGEEALNLHATAEYEFQEAGGYTLDSRVKGLLKGLGFDMNQLEVSPLSLSGGWRMRLELAKIFLNNPDFLILDEPTNHLDLPSLVWVENYLMSFPGTVLFVSHDRALLNRLATHVIHLNCAKLKGYKGNYDAFLKAREEERALLLARKENLDDKKAHLQSFVDRFGAKASKATQAQSRQKMIERLEEEQGELVIEQDAATVTFRPPAPLPSDRVLVSIKQLTVGYAKPLAHRVDLLLERGFKIAIIGANGIGKSTFLKTLAGVIPELSGSLEASPRTKIAYFAQNQLDVFDPKIDVYENLTRLTNLGQKEARQILGSFLFSGDDVYKRFSVLSGGEKSRLGLATLFAKQANLLLLDEPTNHLDMASIDILTRALKTYTGSLVCVSHDREFIQAFATHILAFDGKGAWALVPGDLGDYREYAARTGFLDVLAEENEKQKETNKKALLANPSAPKTKEDSEAKKRLKALDQSIEALTAQIRKKEQEILLVPSHEYLKIMAIQQEIDQCKLELEAKEAEWLAHS